MSFKVGDIPFFKEYLFTDSGRVAAHFGLTLLPETATKYTSSLLCCVITSKKPSHWGYCLENAKYDFFECDSFACFDRKDLVPLNGLDNGKQPRGNLQKADLKEVFKILKKSLFVLKDIASNDPYLRGTIIAEWKSAIKS